MRCFSELRDRWGTQEFCDELLFDIAPSLATVDQERLWFANWLRVGASPSVAYALNRMYCETYLRDVLPAVRVPTLVLYRGVMAEGPAKDVAARIPNSRVIRIPGDDIWGIFLSRDVPDEVERFMADAAGPAEADRVLATLLFTDLVDSTARAATLGDSAWRELLRRHHDCVRQELARHRGRAIDTVGDGFFATFDGPARAIRCAEAIRQRLRELDLGVRAGVHTGECELFDDKPAGIAVHTAARVMAKAAQGEILVTSAVKDLVAGSGITFSGGSEHQLKGLPRLSFFTGSRGCSGSTRATVRSPTQRTTGVKTGLARSPKRTGAPKGDHEPHVQRMSRTGPPPQGPMCSRYDGMGGLPGRAFLRAALADNDPRRPHLPHLLDQPAQLDLTRPLQARLPALHRHHVGNGTLSTKASSRVTTRSRDGIAAARQLRSVGMCNAWARAWRSRGHTVPL